MQAGSILSTEAQHDTEKLRLGPSMPALEALDAIHDRQQTVCCAMSRRDPIIWCYPCSYWRMPGLCLTAVCLITGMLVLAIMAGLVIGKPLGFVLAALLAVRLGYAHKPDAYSWRQLAGAGALAGIGFTMSLFIAGQALPLAHDFAVAKLAVFATSVLSSVIGVAVLWKGARTCAV